MANEEKPKRHRRSSAEVAAEKAEKAAARAAARQGVTAPVVSSAPPGLPQPNGEFMPNSIIDVFAFLAKSKVHPCLYTDAFDLMKYCLDFKAQFNLTDEKFLTLMHAFEDVEKAKKR